jgi:hypothetical protein
MRPANPSSPRSRWLGRLLSGFVILFMVFSGGIKLAAPAPVTENFVRMQIPVELAFGLGVLELACTAVYALPATALYGAILLTGYLGGAVASHLRLHDPWLSHTLFPCYLGLLAWAGLLLRDDRARTLLLSLPCRRERETP